MTLEIVPDVGNEPHQCDAHTRGAQAQAEYSRKAAEERTPRWFSARWCPVGRRGPIIHARRVHRRSIAND